MLVLGDSGSENASTMSTPSTATSPKSLPTSPQFFGGGGSSSSSSERAQRKMLERKLHEQERLVKTLRITIHKLESAKSNKMVDVVDLDTSDI